MARDSTGISEWSSDRAGMPATLQLELRRDCKRIVELILRRPKTRPGKLLEEYQRLLEDYWRAKRLLKEIPTHPS